MNAPVPLANVPMVDKAGKVTIPWLRFFLGQAQGNEAVSVAIGGKTGDVGSLEFGAGFSGMISGSTLALSTGLDLIDEAGRTFAGVSAIVFDGNFGVSGTGPEITLSAPDGAIQVSQGGVTRIEGATNLNFAGAVNVNAVDDTAYILIGGAQIANHGTNLGAASTINAGALLSASSIGPGAFEFDFTGIPAQQGTSSLGAFIDLNVGAGLVATMGTGSLAGTLSLSGTLLEAVEGSTTLTGIVGIAAGANVSLSGTSGGLATIASSSSGGGGGINFGQFAAPSASQTLLVYPVGSGGLTLLTGLPGFAGFAETAPTGSPAWTIYKNGSSIGTINWSAGVNAAAITFGGAVTFAPGDVLTVKSTVTPDATLANFGVTLVPSVPLAGAVQLVSTQTISGASEVDFKPFQSGLDYFVIASDVTNSASDQMVFQFGAGAGPTWLSDSSYYNRSNSFAVPAGGSHGPGTSGWIDISANSYPQGNNFIFEILGSVEAAIWHGAKAVVEYNLIDIINSYQPASPTAITGLRIFMLGGATLSGKFSLYSRQR